MACVVGLQKGPPLWGCHQEHQEQPRTYLLWGTNCSGFNMLGLAAGDLNHPTCWTSAGNKRPSAMAASKIMELRCKGTETSRLPGFVYIYIPFGSEATSSPNCSPSLSPILSCPRLSLLLYFCAALFRCNYYLFVRVFFSSSSSSFSSSVLSCVFYTVPVLSTNLYNGFYSIRTN